MRDDRGTTERTDWGSVVLRTVVFSLCLIGFYPLSKLGGVVATIGDAGIGHSLSDIVSAAAAIIGLLLLVLDLVRLHRGQYTRTSTWEEEREERRAWLADLREQGASRRQRFAQWLSLTFVAGPVMSLRRALGGRRLSGRQHVHSVASWGVAWTLFGPRFPGPWGVTAGLLAVIVLGDVVACWIVGRRERRKARRPEAHRPAA